VFRQGMELVSDSQPPGQDRKLYRPVELSVDRHRIPGIGLKLIHHNYCTSTIVQ
jgi:hypothetical protein